MLTLLLQFIAGLVLTTAFAPLHMYSFAFICPAVLFFCWLKATPGRAALLGLCFGLGFFAGGTSWIYISIHNYGGASTVVAGAITVAFVLYQALFLAIQGYLVKKLFNQQRLSDAGLGLCVFPASWVVFEWLRSHLFTGFPWLLLGYTQLTTPLKHIAPLIGVFGLSLIVAMMAGALAVIGRRTTMTTKWIAVAIIVLPVMIGFFLRHQQWTHPYQSPIQVSLIQGNIPQQLKWQANHRSRIINTYRKLTEQHWNSGLIIWPEAAIPQFASQVQPLLTALDNAAKQHHTQLIIGIPLANYQTGQLYNGLIVLGQYKSRYLKRHLVPFGEYTPLKSIIGPINRWLNIPMSDFSPGPKRQRPLKIANGRHYFYIAPFICYEIAYPLEVIDAVNAQARTSTEPSTPSAQLLVTLLDDSWFGRSIASAQHLQIAQMRALETQRPMLMSSNTGITASINPAGQITQVLPAFKQGVLTTTVQPQTGQTPFMRFKNWPMWASVLVLLLLSIFCCFQPSTIKQTKRNKD